MTHLPPHPDIRAGIDPDLPPELPRQRLRVGVLAMVFVGGCLGGLARYVVTQAWTTPTYSLPWATLLVNVAGCFVLGTVVAADRRWQGRWVRPLLGTGLCGALTTFGAVVVVVARQLAHGHAADAAAYVVITAVGAGLAVAAGLRLVGRRC